MAKKRRVYKSTKPTVRKTAAPKKTQNKQTATKKKLYTESWNEIRHKIYKRDSWTCQCCGKSHCVVSAHHLSPIRVSHDNNMSNLITVCSSCHKKLDNIAFAILRNGGHQVDAVRVQLKIIAEERQKRINKMKKIEEDKKNGRPGNKT